MGTLETYIGNNVHWYQNMYIGNTQLRFEAKNISWKHEMRLGNMECDLETWKATWKHAMDMETWNP